MIYRGDYGRCPCGEKLDASDGGVDKGAPGPGDGIVCLRCEAFLILDDHGKARAARPDEVMIQHYATRRYIRRLKYKEAATARHFNN